MPGVPHHVTQRGNDRRQVFFSSGDHRLYLDLLGLHAARSGVEVLGYCLMPNHVHLLAIPRQEDSLAKMLGRTHCEYAQALNRAREHCGHLWQSRYFSCALDYAHLNNVLRYVDLNPVRAGLTQTACEWRWSSARVHCGESGEDPTLNCDWTTRLGDWDFAEWREILGSVQPEEDRAAVKLATLRGEPLGSIDFVADLEQRVGRRLRVLARGRPRAPTVSLPARSLASPV